MADKILLDKGGYYSKNRQRWLIDEKGGNMESNKLTLVVAGAVAVILSAGLILAGYFVGNGFYMSRMGDRFVTVKGLSERDVVADLAVWNIKIASTGDELSAVQGKIESDKEKLVSFLKDQGIADGEIGMSQLFVTDLLAQQYRQERAETNRFIINLALAVRSADVEKILKASAKVGDLVRQGLVLADNQGPNYFFTKLNDIKPEMIAEATRNARKAAEQFAADSLSSVGPIRRASQGMFSIESRDGAPVEYDETGAVGGEQKRIDKKVRVVSTIDYFLER